MRLRLTVCAIASLLISACGSEPPSLLAGDTGETGTVADESASTVSVSGLTTDEEILGQYPILRLLSREASPQIGSAQFVMVDEAGALVPTESVEHPAFLVELRAWYGVTQPIEFSIHMSYVDLAGTEVTSRQCTDRSGGFSMEATATHRLNRQSFPALRGTSLSWGGGACVRTETLSFASYFDEPVKIDVTSTGFTAVNPQGENAHFTRVPLIDETTQLATTNLTYRENSEPRAVVEPPESPPETTTTVASSSVDILTAESERDEGMQALSEFTLRYDPNLNCLYHDEPDNNGEPGTGGRVVIEWPFGYTAVIAGNGVDVLDTDGITVARTDTSFQIAGGGMGYNGDHCDAIGIWIANGPPNG